MSSQVSPQNNWIPYVTSKDCTQGLCTIYCPQWCYASVFPPPPPLQFLGEGNPSSPSSSGLSFSPLIVAIIGVLASAFLLVTYYTLISKFCRDSSPELTRNPVPDSADPSPGGPDHEPWYVSAAGGGGGLDEALIKSIAVCKYKRGAGMVEGTCSVCLTEFADDETVRLLPKCAHPFHVPCIDTWLSSHSNCPLCRSEVAEFGGSFHVLMPLPLPVQYLPENQTDHGSRGTSSTPTSSSDANIDREETVAIGDHTVKSESSRVSRSSGNVAGMDTVIEVRSCEGLQPIRRSFSAGHECQTVADILKVDQDEEEQTLESTGSSTGQSNVRSVKSSSEICKIGHKRSSFLLNCVTDGPAFSMKRSFSSGRLLLSQHERAKATRTPI